MRLVQSAPSVVTLLLVRKMNSQIIDLPRGGFVYDNCHRCAVSPTFSINRNENLCKLLDLPLKMTKTGTTLAAVTFDVRLSLYLIAV